MEKISKDFVLNNKIHFIYNAIEDGWVVKKRGEQYIFTKNHNNEKEIFSESYLNNFIIKYITNNSSPS
mgnify:CR=1 FL=1|tara:strand:- start:1191 stop:1394 length:204 start_codon:yes stop_codon:yes gene_type:complete